MSDTDPIFRDKKIIMAVIAVAVTWGGFATQVSNSQDKNKEQDAQIEKNEDKLNQISNSVTGLTADQKHFNDTAREIKQNQRDIVRRLTDIADRLPK